MQTICWRSTQSFDPDSEGKGYHSNVIFPPRAAARWGDPVPKSPFLNAENTASKPDLAQECPSTLLPRTIQKEAARAPLSRPSLFSILLVPFFNPAIYIDRRNESPTIDLLILSASPLRTLCRLASTREVYSRAIANLPAGDAAPLVPLISPFLGDD